MTDREPVHTARLWLLTGGAGFIGSHLLRALLEQGERVRVVDDFSTGLRERLAPLAGQFELLEGSVTEPAMCKRACRGVSVVLHEAALTAVQRSVQNPSSTHAVAATGTLNLLTAARDAGVRRFVYAGSSSAYGDTAELPKRESMATNPRSPYAVAKLAGEHYVRVFSMMHELEGVALRYFNVFGPGQDPMSPYAAVIPNFISAAMEGRAPVIYGDGEQTRDFTYVDNVVQATLKAALAAPDRVTGRIFNVGSGSRISINQLWREISDLVGTDLEPTYVPSRPGDVRDSLAALDEIRAALGYEPSVDLREGLRRTVAALADRASLLVRSSGRD